MNRVSFRTLTRLLGAVSLLSHVPAPASADVVSLTLNPASVFGTDSSTGTAVLDGFGRPRTVDLTSSNPGVASVPASVTTDFRDPNEADFAITTHPVAVPTNVTITATEGGVSRQAVLTVRPPALTSVTFNPNPLRGSEDAVATITINRPAPAGWLCSIQGPFPPVYFASGSIVSFPTGATSTTKTVNTVAVTNEVNALITVRPPTGQSPSASSTLPIVPTRAEALTLTPSSVTGGAASLGCVALNGAAMKSGATVQLSSSDPDVAGVPPTIQIVQGDNDGCFIVQSHAVAECASALISATFGGQTAQATLNVGLTEQITDNAVNDHWNLRHSSTVEGRVLWTDGDDVFFDDGANTQLVQARGQLEAVTDSVFGLGSGAGGDSVVGAWRRGQDFAWVWQSGGQPVPVSAVNPIDPKQAMNPEALAIADGDVFLILQAFFNANAVRHVFRVDPATGVATNLTGDAAVPGVDRVAADGGQAAWLYVDSANPKLHFFDGSDITIADSGAINGYDVRLARGRVIYEKVVEGISHIFLYDSTADVPAPVRLSPDTDAAHGNFSPATDGYHVAWLHADANGANPDIMLLGGLPLNDAASRPLVSAGVEFPIQCNRGQLLWKDVQANVRYAAAGTIETLCVTPAQSFTAPWLSDGFIVGFGPVSGSPQTDNEVFLREGLAPNDADLPMAPLLVVHEPGHRSVTLEWDGILGATSYIVYLAEQPGVTKDNYASLPGGRRIDGIASLSTRVCGLANDAAYYFVVTAVESGDEGAVSVEVVESPQSAFASSITEVTQMVACVAGPGAGTGPKGCAAEAFADADVTCDGHVDLRDFAILSNLISQ